MSLSKTYHLASLLKYRRSFLDPASLFPTYNINMNQYRVAHSIKFTKYVKPCYPDHDHKNMGMNRPMSPHLSTAAPVFTAMTSIVQRITGLALASFALLLSLGTLFFSNGVETYALIIQNMGLGGFCALIIKLVLGFPFAYHYFNGLRFIAWNLGKLLSRKEMYDSYKKMCIAAGVTTLIFALLL